MSLRRLWMRRETSPPAPDLAITRDIEDLGNPTALNIALAVCPAWDKWSLVCICLPYMTPGLKWGLSTPLYEI